MGCIEEVSHNAIAVYWNPLESPAKVSLSLFDVCIYFYTCVPQSIYTFIYYILWTYYLCDAHAFVAYTSILLYSTYIGEDDN